MSSEPLKPCPFCGGEARWDDEPGAFCLADCDYISSIDGWNRRPIEDALRAERDRAVDLLLALWGEGEWTDPFRTPTEREAEEFLRAAGKIR